MTSHEVARAAVVGVYNVGLVESRQGVVPIPEKGPGITRLVCMSDTHQREQAFAGGAVPDGDVFVFAGDATSTGAPAAIAQFTAFLRALPHAHKVVIAGNHDVTLDAAFYAAKHAQFHPRG
jgi:3',5'-cyclic AMP phosphodiesterase CpdA